MNRDKLFLLAFIEGSAVMALELLGARLITPLYGTSLLMWTILLSVTLLGLAIGYFIGGWVSQKKTKIDNLLCVFFAIASIGIVLAPVIAKSALLATSDLGLYIGCFTAASLLILIPLAALGSTSAIIIREVSKNNLLSGKSAGSVYAISTIGGVFATFIFGFVLIPTFGVTKPLMGLSWLLMLICILGLSFDKKRIVSFSLIFIIAICSIKIILPNKSNKEIQYEMDLLEEGLMGQLRVDHVRLPVNNQLLPVKRLLVNNIAQTIVRSYSDNTSHWRYIHLMSIIAGAAEPSSSALLCGFGAGSMATELSKHDFKVDAIEIDSRLESIAISHFNFNSNCNFIIDDARHYIKTTEKKYDLIVLDLLKGESQPSNMYTVESFTELRQILTNDGLIIVNFQGSLTGETNPYLSLFGTIEAAGFYVENWRSKTDDGDIIFIVTNPGKKLSLDENQINECCKMFYRDFRNGQITSPDSKNHEILVDDKPKLEHLNQEVVYAWRGRAMRTAKSIIEAGYGFE
ncbi:MAG: fused MFS/spermidine synthase [Flavobacteriales bacterium]|nr:fused MFS/spermidine synthase [Flavobacteriales bacterium]